ncbi:MAG: PLD nuclease N-terminal domain-containing protein [Nesterenkonia sp.]|nr:PLD nuclease N-terminal domain-containing protein [Nesterenkonia sp.]
MRIIIPLGIVALGLMIYSAVECLQTPRERVRVLGKWSWFAVILLVPLIGAGLWLAFGRARKESGQAGRHRPAAPDDDPNFLRGLEIQRRQRQRQEDERRRGSEDARGATGAQHPDADSSEGEAPEIEGSEAEAEPAAEPSGDPAEYDDDESSHAETPEAEPHDGGHDDTDPAPASPDSWPDSPPPPRPGHRDDVDPDEELDPDDPRLDDGGTGTDRPR